MPRRAWGPLRPAKSRVALVLAVPLPYPLSVPSPSASAPALAKGGSLLRFSTALRLTVFKLTTNNHKF